MAEPGVSRRRIWCEMLPYGRLCRSDLLRMLAGRDVEVILAVTPDRLLDLPATVGACQSARVTVGLWPMLDHAHGRWPSAANVERFRAFALRCLDTLDARGLHVPFLAIDLEPPLAEVDALLRGGLWSACRWMCRRRPAPPAAIFRGLVHELHARGLDTLAAVVPTVVTDRAGGARGWQRVLGTPVDGVPFGTVSPILYTSLLEGYSRGALHRRDSVALLAAAARASASRWGPRASLSLGAVGVGVLGHEPTWRSVDELVEDVAQARAGGVDDLALFDLAGVLARPPVEGWLDAFVHTPAARTSTPLTARAAAVVAVTHLAARMVF